MVDREKVLSWLEGLTENDWRDYHSDSEVQNIAKAAFDLLKEQESVEPAKAYSGGGKTWWYVCGDCLTAINPNDKYCHECGQAINWK